MTTLREAAQQALEAWQTATYGHPSHHKATLLAMTALKAALAEPVQEPDSPERRCGGPGCDMKCCQPVQEPQGCEHCNHPLYAAIKCRVCGRVTEPVQEAEPVAWRWGYRSVTTGEMDWRGYVEIAAHPNLRSPAIIMEPLYAAPPQNKENT